MEKKTTLKVTGMHINKINAPRNETTINNCMCEMEEL